MNEALRSSKFGDPRERKSFAQRKQLDKKDKQKPERYRIDDQ